jgi:uncharacterized integral membrane protein (TIGR00698 family)
VTLFAGAVRAAPPLPSLVAGLAACASVGVLLVVLEEQIAWLPAPLLALVLGLLLARALGERLGKGATFAATYLLRAGIVLLGFRLSLEQIGEVGAEALIVIVPCVLLGGVLAFALARRAGLDKRLSVLLGVGTAICGNSAIAAVAPSIDADDDEVAASITTVTVYGTIALIAFPLIAEAVGMTAKAFGVWAGTAINDTSQVVASAFTYSDSAGEMATIVKLARNLFIVPVVFGVAWWGRSIERREAGERKEAGIPWFIVMFVLAAFVASVVSLPDGFVDASSLLSKALILTALAGIGARAASLRFDRRFLVPLAVGSAAGICLAAVSLGLVSFTD